jgi:hypothetical protein
MKPGAVLSCTLALPLSVGAPAESRIESRLDTAQGCFALFKKLDVKGDRRISRDECETLACSDDAQPIGAHTRGVVGRVAPYVGLWTEHVRMLRRRRGSCPTWTRHAGAQTCATANSRMRMQFQT